MFELWWLTVVDYRDNSFENIITSAVDKSFSN